MKKQITILSALLVLLMAGCTKEQFPTEPKTDTVEKKQNYEQLSKVSLHNNVLDFESKEHMEAALVEFIQITNEAKSEWSSSIGFKSIASLYDQANEEINKMMSRNDYDKIVNKYGNAFLFNTTDKEDLPPYFRFNDIAYAPFINIEGKISINGNVVDYNTLNSVEQTQKYIIEQEYNTNIQTRMHSESSLNYSFCNDGKRKMWLHAVRVKGNLYVRVGCQVKSFWGWNTFKQRYSFRPNHNYNYNNWRSDASNLKVGSWTRTAVLSDNSLFYLGSSRIGGSVSGGFMMVEQNYTAFAWDMGSSKSVTFLYGI